MIIRNGVVKLGLVFVVLGGLKFNLFAQEDSVLVEALVKKGVFSKDEAQQIQGEWNQQQKSRPGSFLQLGSAADQQLRLYGDVRLRYQWDNAETQGGSDSNHDKSRYRYRLRVGADYGFAENWKAGVRLETSPRSNTASADFGGFFSKDASGVYVGLAYLEYETTTPMLFGSSLADYADFRAGKMMSPFLIPMAYWCTDITAQGFAEQIGWKNVATDGLDLTLRGGQYLTSNVNEDASLGSGFTEHGSDQFMFLMQMEFKYKFDQDLALVVAPLFMAETNGHANGRNDQDGGAYFDGGVNPMNANGEIILGHVNVLQIPVELSWKSFGKPNKLYGDWGYNFSADERAKAFDMKSGAGNQFFNVGYQIGDTAKKGHWQLGVEYRYTEAMAYDPYLLDSNFALNYANQQGVVLSGAYAFTDNIWGVVTWYMSNPIYGSSSTPVNGINANASGSLIGAVNVVQVDLNWKF
jgi:hypothetical protein